MLKLNASLKEKEKECIFSPKRDKSKVIILRPTEEIFIPSLIY